MSTSRRALLLVLSLACLGVLLYLPASGAAAGGTPTKIIVSLKYPAFHGKLTSPRHACLGSRTVKMFRKRNGKTKLLGTDKSKNNGKWSIPVGNKLTSGEYFATVAKRGKCKGAKSKVLPID